MELIICFYIFGALVTFFLGIFKLEPLVTKQHFSCLAVGMTLLVISTFWPAFWVAVFLWSFVE